MLTKMTNARKISVKMKAQWSKELEETGFLACPISGCSQRYVSMANFTTHYKWCSGEKNFGVCPYCESVIFSDRKSTLHHMEVEHPDKIDEYKANFMIVEVEEPDEACPGTSSEVTSFEEESSDMYVEEVTSKKVGRKPKDRRFYSKENHLFPKRKFFRNKIKNINETVSENIKEFQKCVRFDSIVSKINSVSDSSRSSEILQEATIVKPPRKPGDRKPRYILTGNIGEEPSYFDDDLQSSSDISSVPDDPTTVKLNTKSKLVLDLQRYKRYNEYLKWTRDWGSERKTYSRSKPSERFHPETSTITTLLSSDSFEIQDIHQLMDTPEKSNISLSEEVTQDTLVEQDLEINSEPMVTAKEVSIFQDNLGVDMDGDIVAGNIRTPLVKDNHSEISLLTAPVRDEFGPISFRSHYGSYGDLPLPVKRKATVKSIKVSPSAVLKKTPKETPKVVKTKIVEETPRSDQVTTLEETKSSIQSTLFEETPTSVQKKTPRPIIKQPVITFGKQIILPPEKPPGIQLEAFMKMEKRPCLKMRESNEDSDLSPNLSPNKSSDGTIRSPSLLFPKRKRGRPSKMELQQREKLFKNMFQSENVTSADSSCIGDTPVQKSVSGRLSRKVREMRHIKGRPKFKSLMGTRNKFRGLNRIVYNARRVSHVSMMRRQAMAHRKVRLSNALTQTDSSETIDDIRESTENKTDHNYSTLIVEQSAIDKAKESEIETENINALITPALEVEVSTSVIQNADVSGEKDQHEEAEVPDMNVSSEVTIASDKENYQEKVNSSPTVLTSTPVSSASVEHQSFASSSQDFESCSVISQVIADFETVVTKQRAKEATNTKQLSLSSSDSTNELSNVLTTAQTIASSAVPITESSTVPIAVTTAVSTTVLSTAATAVTSTVPIAESIPVPATVSIAVSDTASSITNANMKTVVPVTLPTSTSVSLSKDANVSAPSTTAQTNVKTVVPVTIPASATVGLSKGTTVSASKASTYVPTIVSINVPTAARPSTPTKTSSNPISIKLVSSTPDTPVQMSFKLNKKLIYHPENQNSREPTLPSREPEKPVVERPITFDELRRSILESSKVPTSLMAVDSIGACTEVVTQDPKAQATAGSPDKNKEEIKVKRPRGRPKKIVDPSLPGQTPSPVKRRGRPRKIRVEESAEQNVPSQTEGKVSENLSEATADSSAPAASNKPQEEEMSMEVDVASEILRIQEGRPDLDSTKLGVEGETSVGEKSVAESVSSEPVLNKELDAEKDASGDIADQALQSKVPENLEKETSELNDSNQAEVPVLPAVEDQPKSPEKPSENNFAVTSTPQVIKLVNSENNSAVAENSRAEDSSVAPMNETTKEVVTDDLAKPRGRFGRKPKRGRKRKTSGTLTPLTDQSTTSTLTPDQNATPITPDQSATPITPDPSATPMVTPDQTSVKRKRGRKPKSATVSTPVPLGDQSATPILTPDQSETPAQPQRRGRGRPRKVVQTESPSQSMEDRSTADISLVSDGMTTEDTTPITADTAYIGLRKSRRSITKKVVTDYSVLEETEIKAKQVEHVPQSTPAKKGNRGRPRKHPLPVEPEPESENSASTTNAPVITRLESAESFQKRGSRKGRPLKCVDYADLNSGNLDEVDKLLEDLDRRSGKADEVIQGEPEPAHPEKVHDDTFILPPKKRKRVPDAKNSELAQEAVQEVPLQEPSTNKIDSVSEPQSTMLPAEVTEAVEIIPEIYSELFIEYLPVKSMYKPLTESEYEAYLPPLKQSICFKIKECDTESDWVSLGQFASLPIGESNHYTFFTGGPVSSSAFCPTWEETQYIALCTCTSMLEDTFYDSIEEEKGIIQIWNLGPLTDSGMVRTPTLDLGITHNYGKVLDMTWCPTGAWQDSTKTSESLPRLGLLAAAFSDSCIRIYSVPHPNFLERDGKKAPLYFASPCITLEPLCEGPCLATRKATCTTLTWQRSNGCEKIAGGYANGMVCLWLVHSSATICSRNEEERVYFPYKIFQAHGTPITGLSFSPLNDRWIVTSSYDKTMKFFDLLDPSIPFSVIKKGFARKVQWANNFCGAYVCLHDDVVYKGCSFFKECGSENLGTLNLSTPYSLICESALSTLKNYYALADVDGTVAVSVLKNMHQEHAKSPCYTAVKLFQTEIVPCDKSSVQPIFIENEVAEECPDVPMSDPLGDFINSLDSNESDEASLSNSILLVQLLDMLREQSCDLELSVKEKLKALCEPLQDLIDNLEDLDENSYIKFSILEKSFALNREMFDRILVTDVPMDGIADLREEEIDDVPSEPVTNEKDAETTSNGELNIEKQSTVISPSNEQTSEALSITEESRRSNEVQESDAPLCRDSDNIESESLDKPSAKETESSVSDNLGSEVEIDSCPVSRESECISQSTEPDSKEVETDSDLTLKEAENHPQLVAPGMEEETVSSTLISVVKETDSSVVEAGSLVSESHEAVIGSSQETISDPCVLDSKEKEVSKIESAVALDTKGENFIPVSTESDLHDNESVSLELSETIVISKNVSGSTERHVALTSDVLDSKETVSVVSDNLCPAGEEIVSSVLEKDSESLDQESRSIDSTVIAVSKSLIDTVVQREESLEKNSSAEIRVVDSISEEICVDGQLHNESPCVNQSGTLEDAPTNLLPCDSTTENTLTQRAEESFAGIVLGSLDKDENMEVDIIPDKELEKIDDVESIASETLEDDFSDFIDSDSNDSLLSECSIETESAVSSEAISPIIFAEDSLDTIRDPMPIQDQDRSNSTRDPTSNTVSKDMTFPPIVSLEMPVEEQLKAIPLDAIPLPESNTHHQKVSSELSSTGDNAADAIPSPQSNSTGEKANEADVKAPEETILSTSSHIQSLNSLNKLSDSDNMEVDQSLQDIVQSSEERAVVQVELSTPALQSHETNQNTDEMSESTPGISESTEGVSICGESDSTDLVPKNLENRNNPPEDTVENPDVSMECETITEKMDISDRVSENAENVQSVVEDVGNADAPSENIEIVAENIKSEGVVSESSEGTAENIETVDVVYDSSDIFSSQPRRPATKRAFLQGLKGAQIESLFNGSREMKREEYFVNYKKVKPVKEDEDFASNHGLIFRDIFLNDPNDLNKGNSNELDEREIHLNSYGVSSINTLSWNPNQGSKYWIFSAGNSGLARLSCLSNIASLEQTSKRKRRH